MNPEEIRLHEDRKKEKNWKRWGPYLSERQWATVREDYSFNSQSWDYFPFEHASARVYRWGEDGILGLTDRECRLCFSLAFWNGQDPILKERIFGVIPSQGNHGEDVKECYYYLDSTPTHSYMKGLYKYPQTRFPYERLIDENQKRGLAFPEFELTDTGIFDEKRYFDIFAEYAKASPDDILIQVTIENRFAGPAKLYFLPTLWFRNTWAWGKGHEGSTDKLSMSLIQPGLVGGTHPSLGKFYFSYQNGDKATALFTENETNLKKLYGIENQSDFVKDGFQAYLIEGKKEQVNPKKQGSKFTPLYELTFEAHEKQTLLFRLSCTDNPIDPFGSQFQEVFNQRKAEANTFYSSIILNTLNNDEKEVARQAFGGLLWSKQFYHFVIEEWFRGDAFQPPPPPDRLQGRNKEWKHLFSRDVISMPDKWEYPWFAAWDLSFHMIPFSKIDPDFAKQQLILFLREWYMHPNGQQPAYEYEFSDVNPPVHAWAVWRVYKMSAKQGERDYAFLESAFQKLLLNFTWWVNRKDKEGNNLFSGGFLGLDNIGIFDRSKIACQGAYLEQADGTAWMAFYCLTMLAIALELGSHNPAYEDMASKFFEHFIHISDAINEFGGTGLWDEQDGFYYDLLKHEGRQIPIRTRSLVGLIPLLAVEILEDRHLKQLKGFSKRMEWFLNNRGDLEDVVTFCKVCSLRGHRILAIPSKERLLRIFKYLFDENEFLSPYGIRSLSKYYEKHPYTLTIGNEVHKVDYVPGVGNTYMFGGNSNWRGPIWFPLNYLIIEALERYDYFYGEGLQVEFPTGSGEMLTLKQAAENISQRLISIFMPGKNGYRPCFDSQKIYAEDPDWRQLLLFNEYFHAETGEGLGANHQTGWTALVARLLQEKATRLANPSEQSISYYAFHS